MGRLSYMSWIIHCLWRCSDDCFAGRKKEKVTSLYHTAPRQLLAGTHRLPGEEPSRSPSWLCSIPGRTLLTPQGPINPCCEGGLGPEIPVLSPFFFSLAYSAGVNFLETIKTRLLDLSLIQIKECFWCFVWHFGVFKDLSWLGQAAHWWRSSACGSLCDRDSGRAKQVPLCSMVLFSLDLEGMLVGQCDEEWMGYRFVKGLILGQRGN